MKRRHRHWLLREFDDGNFWNDDGDDDSSPFLPSLVVFFLEETDSATYYGMEIQFQVPLGEPGHFGEFEVGTIVVEHGGPTTVSMVATRRAKAKIFQASGIKSAIKQVQQILQKRQRGMKFPIRFIRKR